MSFLAQQKISLDELGLRHQKCRELLQKYMPTAQGLLVFSRSNIYYLSGTRGNGMLWLPIEGEPVLMVRKGEERCRLESSLPCIATFKSYSNIPDICSAFNSPLGNCVGAEMQALPWSLAQMLQERLKHIAFKPANFILEQARFIKTPFELELLHEANALHVQALQEQILGLETYAENSKVILEQLEKSISISMTEREIAHNLWHRFFTLGHGGMLRLHGHAQEVFLGKVSVGLNSLYPSAYKGCVGLVGEHPAIPFMGNADSVWHEGQTLMMDTAFMNKGYHSSIAMTYFGGDVDDLPSEVEKAYECCLQIIDGVVTSLNEAKSKNYSWQKACDIARQYGFDEGFMGLGANKRPALAHGLGLELDEGLVIGAYADENYFNLEVGAVLNIGPMIALPAWGMIGLKHSFTVSEQGKLEPFSGLDTKQFIECVY